MLTTRYGETPSSRADYVESQRDLAGSISQSVWRHTNRWFDFEFRSDGDIEVLEHGVAVGRITDLSEAEDFVDWLTEVKP